MAQNKKRLPKPVKIILIIVLIIYLLFVLTRLTGRFLTYIPFSGRIFSLQEGDAERISIEYGGSFIADYADAEAKKEIIEKLNAIRYSAWLPDPKVLFSAGGWTYRFRFWQGTEVISYEFGENWIRANGFLYLVSQSQMEVFIQAAEEAAATE